MRTRDDSVCGMWGVRSGQYVGCVCVVCVCVCVCDRHYQGWQKLYTHIHTRTHTVTVYIEVHLLIVSIYWIYIHHSYVHTYICTNLPNPGHVPR